MKEYDRDGSGVLDFNEFVAFICSGENKLKLSPEQKANPNPDSNLKTKSS